MCSYRILRAAGITLAIAAASLGLIGLQPARAQEAGETGASGSLTPVSEPRIKVAEKECGPSADQPPVPDVETFEEYWPNGQLRLRKQVLQLEDGTIVDHGTFQRWHDNGKKEYEAVFVQGRKEGTTIRYHKNGRKATEQEYRNGKRHGRCVAWNDSGAKVKEENWENGKPHGTWTIWDDGKVKWSHTYDHGKP